MFCIEYNVDKISMLKVAAISIKKHTARKVVIPVAGLGT